MLTEKPMAVSCSVGFVFSHSRDRNSQPSRKTRDGGGSTVGADALGRDVELPETDQHARRQRDDDHIGGEPPTLEQEARHRDDPAETTTPRVGAHRGERRLLVVVGEEEVVIRLRREGISVRVVNTTGLVEETREVCPELVVCVPKFPSASSM